MLDQLYRDNHSVPICKCLWTEFSRYVFVCIQYALCKLLAVFFFFFLDCCIGDGILCICNTILSYIFAASTPTSFESFGVFGNIFSGLFFLGLNIFCVCAKMVYFPICMTLLRQSHSRQAVLSCLDPARTRHWMAAMPHFGAQGRQHLPS